MMERKGKKLLKLLTAAAGLLLLVAFAAPSAFAFGGGGVWPQTVGSAADGLPKPVRRGAPVGAFEARAMTSGLTRPETSPLDMTLTHNMAKVKLGRYERTTVAREVATARSQGFNVSHAEIDELMGNEALSYGNNHAAIAYYNRAERQLRATGFPAPVLVASR